MRHARYGCLVHRPHADRLASGCALVALLTLGGCGGAMPLGHPAHALPAGKVNVGAGVAGTFALGTRPTVGRPTARFQDLAIGPDVSPWVSARAGLGSGFEAGLGASARAVRLDGRRAFTFCGGRCALSIGVGASALVGPKPSGGGGDATKAYGGGIDVPLLVGWHSKADLYSLWAGPRVGAQLLSGQLDPGTGVLVPVSGRAMSVGGLVGLRAGLRHLFAVVELEVAHRFATGTIGAETVSVAGCAVTPFGGLVVSF